MSNTTDADAAAAQSAPKNFDIANPPHYNPTLEYIDYQFAAARTKWHQQPSYVPISDTAFSAKETAIRLIAFYFPQFHVIPENDEWWGKGFTDWTNVTRAVPLFAGHEQPRLPGELGFYDPTIPSVMERQVELAKHYGIGGWCFHYYWFAGKRMLAKPLDNFLNNPKLDLPFCINWANENWARTWDGLNNNILLAQNHSPEDDEAMMRDVCRYLRDPRYIRVDGKPLVSLYRASVLPDARATIERWRNTCRKEGVGDIFVATVRSVPPTLSPDETGADAEIEFPPLGADRAQVDIRPWLQNRKATCAAFDYRAAVVNHCRIEPGKHPLFRGVMPGWDNTARRPDASNFFLNYTPELYNLWLTHMCHYTLQHNPKNHNLVFVNAWNEWAEGAYLEPDRRNGYAYLQATADALRKFPV